MKRLFINEAQQHWPNIPGEFVHLSITADGDHFRVNMKPRAWSPVTAIKDIPMHNYTLN